MRVLSVTVFILAIVPSAIAQVAVQEAVLQSSDGLERDRFGTSVASSGNTIVVGAPGDVHPPGVPSNPLGPGSAYVFVRNMGSWSEQAKLIASDAPLTHDFGISAAIDADTAVIGALGAPGWAYVFVRNGTVWTEQQKLVPTIGGLLFETSVAISGDTIVVGDPDGAPSLPQLDDGVAHVFVRTGTSWNLQAQLVANPLVSGDRFASSVAIDANTILVGAPLDGPGDGGAAYVFTRTGATWTQAAKLKRTNPGKDDGFGTAVAVLGDRAIIGAPGDNTVAGSYAGSAHVFFRTGATWSTEAMIFPIGAAPSDLFGSSVALSANRALVGAPGVDLGAAHVGAAYTFARAGTSWGEEYRLFPSAPATDEFGSAVSLSGSTFAVGIGWYSTFGEKSYVYVEDPTPATPVTYCSAGISASECQVTIQFSGKPSATASSGFYLLASAVEGNKNGLFFFGTNGRQAAPWGNGTSYQCVVPPVKRTPKAHGGGSNAVCNGSFARDLNAHWTARPAVNPGAGAVVQAQLWYRDPKNTSNRTTSLSGAIEFQVAP